MYRPRNVKRTARRGVSNMLMINLGPLAETRSIMRVTSEQIVPMSAWRYIGLVYVQLNITNKFS